MNSITQFALEVVAVVRAEWRKRTWFGKLLFPLWFLNAVLLWVVTLSFIGFIRLGELLMQPRDVGWPTVLPTVYKETTEDSPNNEG